MWSVRKKDISRINPRLLLWLMGEVGGRNRVGTSEKVNKGPHLRQAEGLIRWMFIIQLGRQKYNRTPSISAKGVDKWHYHLDQC